jgi:GT2 family glycosyltransferase
MNHNEKVSICIVTQDNADSIRILLNSILTLKGKEALDVVIVDNYSVDQTKEIIDEFRDKLTINYIHGERRRSLAANRNLCVRKSTADIVVMVDSDTEFVQPVFIENVITIFYSNKDVGVLSPIVVDARTGLVQSLGLRKLLGMPYVFVFNFPNWNPDDLRNNRTLDLFKIDMIHGACFIFRKSIFEKIGGFDEYMEPYNFDEMDFAIRASLRWYKLFGSSTLEIRHYGGGTTGGFKREYRAELFIRHGMRSIIRNYSKKPMIGSFVLSLFAIGSIAVFTIENKRSSGLFIVFRSFLWALRHKSLSIINFAAQDVDLGETGS